MLCLKNNFNHNYSYLATITHYQHYIIQLVISIHKSKFIYTHNLVIYYVTFATRKD